ncbi:unnamed protein product [Meloidogyne enterolobii]|uniref:Uncharacterized protein n=1 Tax=Meloidogyne enterolobii TaxID=390850 RepID=A0ACB1ARG5_MELEN
MGFNPTLVWDSQSCSLFTLFFHHFFHFLYFSFFPSYFFLSSQKNLSPSLYPYLTSKRFFPGSFSIKHFSTADAFVHFSLF